MIIIIIVMTKFDCVREGESESEMRRGNGISWELYLQELANW